MKFGVRDIANCVFKAKTDVQIGTSKFKEGQPVLYIDTATTSTLEGAATTVYAQGGRGNTRLIAWEGEKTLTFTVEDALLSPIGFAVLSGAGLFKKEGKKVHVHTTTAAVCSTSDAYKTVSGVSDDKYVIDISDALGRKNILCTSAPIFVVKTEKDGSVTGEMLDVTPEVYQDKTDTEMYRTYLVVNTEVASACSVFVDYYVVKDSAKVSEIQIDAENFAGYYYVEADTLFRDQSTGKDMPANITLPNVKIQSNFTFSMAATGDPSTFTFTMDAFPGYTYFDSTKKVLCVIQVVEDTSDTNIELKSVMPHGTEAGEEVKAGTKVEKALECENVTLYSDLVTDETSEDKPADKDSYKNLIGKKKDESAGP